MKQDRRNLVLATLGMALALGTPAWAGTRIEKTLELAPGGRLVVDADGGSVVVKGRPGSGVHLVILSNRDDLESQFTFKFEELAGLIRITADRKGGEGLLSFLTSAFRGTLRYEIDVPQETGLEVDTAGGSIDIEGIRGAVRLDTSGGSIQVADVRGDVAADTSGGSIHVQKVDGNVQADTSGGGVEVAAVKGNVKIETSGGSIRASGVSGDLAAETSGGSIAVDQAGGSVVAETSGGSVSVSFAPGNSRGGSLATSGGGIDVSLDRAASLEIEASASGGSVTSDLPITIRESSKSSLSGKLGAGGARLVLRATGGPIRLAQL